MKHRKAGRKFGRVRNQRRALKKTLAGSLIMEEKITTTLAKAKELRPLVEKMITKSKPGYEDGSKKLSAIRYLQGKIPALAVKKLFSEEYKKRFEKRSSGYIRIVKIGSRKTDNAEMAIIEFV